MRNHPGVVRPILRPGHPCEAAEGPPFAGTQTPELDVQSLLLAREDIERSGVVCARDGRRVRLQGLIASGGEGTVFQTDQLGVVCKIYHGSRLTIGAQRKIALMETRRIAHSAICWPLGDHAGFRAQA